MLMTRATATGTTAGLRSTRKASVRSCWCSRAAERSAPTRPASMRRCTRPGIEPDWVIGTSIGAINASLIAGNPPGKRLARLREFWRRVEHGPFRRWSAARLGAGSTGRQRHDHGGRGATASSSPTRGPSGSRARCRSAPRAPATTRPRRWRRRSTDLIDLDCLNRRKPTADRRRRQCPHRRDALLRQPRHARSDDPPRHGVGRAAAGLSRPCASTASFTGTAASCPTRRSRPCSTTIPRRNGVVFAVHIWNPHWAGAGHASGR